MQTNFSNTIAIGSSVPSDSWLKVAMREAAKMAKEQGVEWKDFEAVIFLPERGRYYVKSKGYVTMSSHG